MYDWVEEQQRYAEENPLGLKNDNFFIPVREASITSKPRSEQDVIALFNQMIAGGIIRGIKILATSQHDTYDGVYKVWIKEPFVNHLFDAETNPLGIEKIAKQAEFTSKPYVLEYKHSFDNLLADLLDLGKVILRRHRG